MLVICVFKVNFKAFLNLYMSIYISHALPFSYHITVQAKGNRSLSISWEKCNKGEDSTQFTGKHLPWNSSSMALHSIWNAHYFESLLCYLNSSMASKLYSSIHILHNKSLLPLKLKNNYILKTLRFLISNTKSRQILSVIHHNVPLHREQFLKLKSPGG